MGMVDNESVESDSSLSLFLRRPRYGMDFCYCFMFSVISSRLYDLQSTEVRILFLRMEDGMRNLCFE